MKKKFDFDSIIKTIGIIAIIVLVILYFQERSNKAYNERNDTWFNLSVLAEDVQDISNDAFDAYEMGDYDFMKEILYSVYEKCDDISDKIELEADKFADRNTD